MPGVRSVTAVFTDQAADQNQIMKNLEIEDQNCFNLEAGHGYAARGQRLSCDKASGGYFSTRYIDGVLLSPTRGIT